MIAIMAALLAVLLPSLQKTRRQTRKVICASNLRSVGTAIHAYANDFGDTIPFGPDGQPMGGSQFYTATGNVTSLISLYNGSPVGLGLLLDNYLAHQPKVLFCPAADQLYEAGMQLARVGKKQAECDYYYRHASVALLTGEADTFNIRLSNLGKNRNGRSIAALAMDVQFLADPALAAWGVKTRTAHRREIVNILYASGSVLSVDNTQDWLTVDIGGYPYDALDKILRAFERGDQLR